MAANPMHNLTTLIKRLEAATSRLEDMATAVSMSQVAVPTLDQTLASPKSISSSISAGATSAPIPAAPAAPAAPPPEPLPEAIEEFDNFIKQSVEKYVNLSNKIGGPVAEQAANVLRGFNEQRNFLLLTTKAKKPDMRSAAFQELLQPMADVFKVSGELRDTSRKTPLENHLTTVNEGLMAMAWVTIPNKPYKHVEESLSAAQFFGNKVLKEAKAKGDSQHIDWVQSYYQLLRDLAEHIKNTYPTEIPWNPKGLPVQEAVKAMAAQSAAAAPAPPPPSAGGPPPPPPPGPPPVLKINEAKAEPAPAGGFGAVFSELNKGESVTKGLRKVDKSEMTHKNPSLRASSKVPDGEGAPRGKSPTPPGTKPPKPESMRVKKPPKKVLEGNKWTIENFDKEPTPVEIEASISHSILISKCTNAIVIIKGKANAVTVENTSRLSLVVDSLVSTVDVVKSANFALEVQGTIPTVMMDQVDGAQVYFSKESTSTRVYTSKSAGVNLNVIAGPDDYKEVPLPSQICSYFDAEKGDLVNEIVSHAG